MTKVINEEYVFGAPITFVVLPKRFPARFRPSEALPTVINNDLFIANGTVTITNFIEAAKGQRIHILGNGTTQVEHNANIKTNTGATKLLADGLVYRFTHIEDVWYEDEAGAAGGGVGDVHVRGTVVYDCGIIGPNERHVGVVALGKGGVGYKLMVNNLPAHITLYATANARALDGSRNPNMATAPIYEDPETEAGVLLDVVVPHDGVYGIPTLYPPWIFNNDDPAVVNIYLAAKQLTDGFENLVITFTRLPVES